MCLGGIPRPDNNMAQSKSFFGLRRGSTKSLTFSVYNGKQVTKDRVTEVKNPRSSMQMEQRAYMASTLKAYAAMKSICDHSREGVPYGQKTMNAFISNNINMLRSKAKNVNLSGYKDDVVKNPWIISSGSLPAVPLRNSSPFVNFECNKFSTLGDVFDAMGVNTIGDMITFVFLHNGKFVWVRLTRTATNEKKASGDGKLYAHFTPNVDIETNLESFGSVLNPYDFELSSSENIIACSIDNASVGAILSRKENGKWLRSSSVMLLPQETTFNYDSALATYPTAGEVILNGGNV